MKTVINVKKQILEALEAGRDAAAEVAANYAESMRGYRPERPAAYAKDVADIDAAIAVLRADIAREEAQTVEPVAVVIGFENETGNVIVEQACEGPTQLLKIGDELFTRPAPPPSCEREALIARLKSAHALHAKVNAMNGSTRNGTLFGEAADMLSDDAQRIAELEALSVTNILLEVVPGWDGMGEEVYAKSVDSVVNVLTNLSEKLEDAQDEWHRGRAAGIEECERVNAELKKQAQQTKGDEDEQVRSEVDAVGGCQSMEMSGAGFVGGRDALVAAMVALLKLDAAGALVPHGIGGHARTLLTTAVATISAQQGEVQQGFTTGHCKEHSKPGGCQLHNLQCGYPDCDRNPAAPQAERVPMTMAEIKKVISSIHVTDGMDGDEWDLKLARVIEAHHGIKP